MTITSTLVDICVNKLPGLAGAQPLAVAQRCLVDSLACAYAGADEKPIQILRETLRTRRGGGESSVIAHDESVRADDAALVNGTMISVQQFDDSQMQMRAHPSAPLLPAVLAVAEEQDRTLTQALTAFVVGYELQCRLGVFLNPSHYEAGWHATLTQGTMGAAMASCLLLDLDAGRTAYALGIAASMASGLRRNFGTMTMSLHCGWAAGSGVRAASFAAAGLTADPNIFDGPRGYGEVFSREWAPEKLAADLPTWGSPFSIISPGACFKLFPCGRPTLFGLQAALALREKHGITPADVEKIVCDVTYMFPRTLVQQPPANAFQGKTSLHYVLAATLHDGPPTLETFTDEAVRRPEIQDLVSRIELRVPPELSEQVPAVRLKPFEQPITVTVHTRDGRTVKETVVHLKGSPENPASDADMRQKFSSCTRGRLTPQRADAALSYIGSGRASVRGLFELLRAAS